MISMLVFETWDIGGRTYLRTGFSPVRSSAMPNMSLKDKLAPAAMTLLLIVLGSAMIRATNLPMSSLSTTYVFISPVPGTRFWMKSGRAMAWSVFPEGTLGMKPLYHQPTSMIV